MKKQIIETLTLFFLFCGSQFLNAQNYGGYEVTSTVVLAETGG